MKFNEIFENKQYHLIGDCISAFDDNGCSFYNYNDVNDFAVGEENSEILTKDEFLQHIAFNSIIDSCDIFSYDEVHDVYIAYDSNKDIHYFFTR